MTEGTLFAVKYIDFDLEDKSYDAVESRESFVIEKYILSQLSHPNVVPIRMAINMGNSIKEELSRYGDNI